MHMFFPCAQHCSWLSMKHVAGPRKESPFKRMRSFITFFKYLPLLNVNAIFKLSLLNLMRIKASKRMLSEDPGP